MSVFALVVGGPMLLMALVGLAGWLWSSRPLPDYPLPPPRPPEPKFFTCRGCKTNAWPMGWSGPPGAEDYHLCPNCSGAD